ncbi:MAG: hypothetical protein JWO62_2496 [Acidimicrobiaceae bacterium]|nr:hypothetical protein [Acidimicrobiaceae bacterium]
MLKADPIDARDSNEPADPIEPNDPADPMLSTEPAEPIDRIEPLEPIDRIEPVDPIDNRLRGSFTTAILPADAASARAPYLAHSCVCDQFTFLAVTTGAPTSICTSSWEPSCTSRGLPR